MLCEILDFKYKFLATWSKFNQENNPEDSVTAQLEVFPLWNSEQNAATIRELVSIVFFQSFGSKIAK